MPQPPTSQARDRYWQPFEASASDPWTIERVVHLHRRVGFAATWSEIQRDLKAGCDASIARLLAGEMRPRTHGFDELASAIGDVAAGSASTGRLKAWWLYRMLLSPDPLRERLSLMWHSHFATSNLKVKNLALMRGQNELLRQFALSPYSNLLKAVIKHPAILLWLDADANRKGNPNENLARELMELFTVGIGNYTESDVKEAARALTGLSVVDGKYGFDVAHHDGGPKTVLSDATVSDVDSLLDLLLDQKATAHRLASVLCETLMGESAYEAGAVRQLAEGLMARDLDIGWATETVLKSRAFFAEKNLHCKVLNPIQFMIGALHALELDSPPPSTLVLARWARRMGQDLFYPPNVGGWKEDRAWLGSRTLVARANFATELARGQLSRDPHPPNCNQLLQRYEIDSHDPYESTRWLATLLWGHAPVATVESVVEHARASDRLSPLNAILAELLTRPEHILA